jgi:hypothetical protein
VLFDLLLQILNPAFDFVEETAAYAANCLIISLVQPTRAFWFSLFGSGSTNSESFCLGYVVSNSSAWPIR